jgi:hypothetical protein
VDETASANRGTRNSAIQMWPWDEDWEDDLTARGFSAFRPLPAALIQ